MSKDITRGEITMEGDERIASMVNLNGRPNVYLVMTTRAVMWYVTVTVTHGRDDQWGAKWVASKSDLSAPHDSGML